MKVILVVAVSEDGYITDSEGKVTTWTSKEDQEFFARMKSIHKLFVMGSGTFDAEPKPGQQDILRVILTSRPNEYKKFAIPHQLEFHSFTAEKFIDKYSAYYESCLLLGGSHMYSEFLEKGLVDEIYLTIEPIKLGGGTPFLRNNKKLETVVPHLPKPRVTELNQNGTLLIHYPALRR